MSVKLSRLSHMTPGERDDAIRDLLDTSENAARRNLDARIREYEVRYEMSTGDMLDRWRGGELRETAEIARWLLLASARNGEVVR